MVFFGAGWILDLSRTKTGPGYKKKPDLCHLKFRDNVILCRQAFNYSLRLSL